MISDELLHLRVSLDLKNNADKVLIKLVLTHKIPIHQVLLLLYQLNTLLGLHLTASHHYKYNHSHHNHHSNHNYNCYQMRGAY